MTLLLAQLKMLTTGSPGGVVLPATLQNLTLSSSSVPENTAPGAAIGLLSGRTPGSTITLIDDAGNRFALNGAANGIVTGLTALNFEAGVSHSIIVEETLATAVVPTRQSTIAITVTNVLDTILSPLSLSATTISEAAAPGAVIGALGGTTAGASPSLVDGHGGRVALIGTDLVVGATDIDALATPTLTVIVRQTHPDAALPLDTTFVIDVERVNASLTVTGTLDPAQFNVAYSDSLTVSGGTVPYSVSGLPPYGISATIIGGTISFTGTPR
ncbi:cadherin repeat domain-containing protein [Sphingobium fluviale]|uniref:Cadherin repeat domain-containing protein n=1 Tax=Sphingobium fluviale TaxID=2506423 RepID=A0A4Q1KHD2_9SPHN|nr:cadherin repeat domain-containing protein [Sphingobium fluviale]RXR28967.1 cadherin repeat domain-containing protein [Sphingobium fluviale]